MAADPGPDPSYVDLPQRPFQPTAHDGVPVELPGTYRDGQYGKLGRHRHPPVPCPAPRYPATLRGYYRCPACGEKAPLAGQLRVTEEAQELADRWLDAVAGGVVQAFWLTVGIAEDVVFGLRWVWWWLRHGRAARKNDGGVTPEMVRALLIAATVAARNRPQRTVSEAKECEECDD